MLQIILLTLYNHIASLLDQGSNRLYILLKLADNTNTGNILQFFFHSLHRNMLALHFLKNTAHALNPALHLLNRAVNIILSQPVHTGTKCFSITVFPFSLAPCISYILLL